MECNIRKMKIEDKKAVYEMLKTFYSSPAVFTDGSDEIFLNDIENCVNDNPLLEGYIIEKSNEIIGYGMVSKSFSTEFGKTCIWLEDIYLKEPYRGLGIGKLYLDFVINKYPNCIFKLEAEKANSKAIKFYEKYGFTELPYVVFKK